jgi:Na+/proline symporter
MSRFARALVPWAGLGLGALAWGLHHQVLSDSLRYDCSAVSPPRAVLALAVALVLCVAGAAVSWFGTRPDPGAGSGRVFTAWMSVLCAGIFALAVLMQAMASLSVPGCFR